MYCTVSGDFSVVPNLVRVRHVPHTFDFLKLRSDNVILTPEEDAILFTPQGVLLSPGDVLSFPVFEEDAILCTSEVVLSLEEVLLFSKEALLSPVEFVLSPEQIVLFLLSPEAGVMLLPPNCDFLVFFYCCLLL